METFFLHLFHRAMTKGIKSLNRIHKPTDITKEKHFAMSKDELYKKPEGSTEVNYTTNIRYINSKISTFITWKFLHSKQA